MGLSKTEINLKRLLAAMPQQANQAKLVHYIATLREQLAELTGESGQGDLPRISAAKAEEYAEQIEAISLKINPNSMPDMWDTFKIQDAHSNFEEASTVNQVQLPKDEPSSLTSAASSGLRKRHLPRVNEGSSEQPFMKETGTTTHEFVKKHRHLQEDLTDDLVGLARQMKETSLLMNQSLLESEKVLDSTERAVEHSLASTNRANQRAGEIYSQSFKTGCLTWLVIFAMFCMFMFMVFLIRVT